MKKKFVPEIVPLRLTSRNQYVHVGELMREGAYTSSSTSVKEK